MQEGLQLKWTNVDYEKKRNQISTCNGHNIDICIIREVHCWYE